MPRHLGRAKHASPVPSAAAPPANLRRNNFDLLRFGFAFTVFLVHAYALSGEPALAGLAQLLSSEIAVKSFFVVSGFLIFKSYEESSSTPRFFNKRLRRIYPAYVCVILACAVLGGLLSTLPWQAYVDLGVLRYIAANLVFLNFLGPDLPGLFAHNPLSSVNGALWTLKIEVMFYLAVPLMVWSMRRFGYLLVLLVLYALSVAYFEIIGAVAQSTGSALYLEMQRQLPGQLAYFVAGALGYYYLHLLARRAVLWAVLASLVLALQAWQPSVHGLGLSPWLLLPWLRPVALATLVVGTACIAPCLGSFGKHGDFSYGIYILHFPILQTLVAVGAFQALGAVPTLALAACLVLSSAVLLWKLVEQPWLQKTGIRNSRLEFNKKNASTICL